MYKYRDINRRDRVPFCWGSKMLHNKERQKNIIVENEREKSSRFHLSFTH